MALKDTTDKELLKVALQAGIFSRVARNLGLDSSHVRRVALGQRTSRKVATALKRELKRIERELTGSAA